jgi:hypothetical protein
VTDLPGIYDALYDHALQKDFAGHDPFDGLNSQVFQALPVRRSRLARLAWLQILKRSPVDLRRIARVPPGVNPKALALFALAELSRFRASGSENRLVNARGLLDRLADHAINGSCPDGSPWTAYGYNFDWQSRVFFAPVGTPAIVPTAFASQAMVEAFHATDDQDYLDRSEEICRFILCSLNRYSEHDDEVCFSYTPLDNSRIFNASLLAGECLARVGGITKNDEYLDRAAKAVRYVIRRQRGDGAWVYGEKGIQSWADNFHTAYVLLSLHRIGLLEPQIATEAGEPFNRGLEYWLGNFFLDDGPPRYYDNGTYPIDIHAAAVAISTLAELATVDERALPLARKVAAWTIDNMRGPRGFFYYQRRKVGTVKAPYMRWGQAWTAYALAKLMEADSGS